ncbi:MAG: anti-sigma factor [Bacillus sp. (in: firmicutes)]
MSDKMNPNEDELYQNFIKNTKKEYKKSHILTEEDQRTIFNVGKNHARLTNIFISLAVLLLIIPVMTLITYFYYAIGGRADKLIEVASNTIYVTEPNINLEKIKIEDEIGLFSMHILFDVNKRIGKEDYKAGNYDIFFALDQPNFPKKTSLLERPLPEIPSVETETLLHPDAKVPFDTRGEWDILKGLPDGTVAEVYVSFSALHKPEEMEQIMPKETEVRWLAVDTGLEEKQVDKEGVPITAIGYPAQVDSTIWSPFNGREQTNEEVFMDILTQLSKNEEVATKVARAKSLELKERIAYIKKNGIQVYGAVVTGPTSELRKLEQMKEVRAVKVGEVKLWNWK